MIDKTTYLQETQNGENAKVTKFLSGLEAWLIAQKPAIPATIPFNLTKMFTEGITVKQVNNVLQELANGQDAWQIKVVSCKNDNNGLYFDNFELH